jgi:HEAT repeat protein
MSAIPFGSEMQLEDHAMLAAIDDPDEGRARASLRVLSALAALNAPDTAVLLWHLDGDDGACRALAARALASPRHAAGATALRARLADDAEEERVRTACAHALAGQGDAGAEGALLAAASASSAPVRQACADALGKLDPSRRAHSTLAALSRDDDPPVRVSALTALLVIGGACARRAALGALDCADAPTVAAALLVLARHGQPADLALARAHKDAPDARVRRAARSCVDELTC